MVYIVSKFGCHAILYCLAPKSMENEIIVFLSKASTSNHVKMKFYAHLTFSILPNKWLPKSLRHVELQQNHHITAIVLNSINCF